MVDVSQLSTGNTPHNIVGKILGKGYGKGKKKKEKEEYEEEE